MESWDAYDVDRIPTGKSVIRGAKHPEGLYHMVVHIAIFSTDGRLLIQQRCTQKATFPKKWDVTVGGSALSGETSRQAMHRELCEELGIDIDFSDIRPRLTANFEDGFDDYYIIVKDIALSGRGGRGRALGDARRGHVDDRFGRVYPVHEKLHRISVRDAKRSR